MAFTLAQLRNQILTSLHGRRLGMDANEFLVGQKGLRRPVSNATSDTTATALGNHGIHTVSTTTNDTWTLESPVVGCEVVIGTASTSTGNHVILPSPAVIMSSNGVAGSSLIMIGAGSFIRLVGVTTAQWLVTGRCSSVGTGATATISS